MILLFLGGVFFFFLGLCVGGCLGAAKVKDRENEIIKSFAFYAGAGPGRTAEKGVNHGL